MFTLKNIKIKPLKDDKCLFMDIKILVTSKQGFGELEKWE